MSHNQAALFLNLPVSRVCSFNAVGLIPPAFPGEGDFSPVLAFRAADPFSARWGITAGGQMVRFEHQGGFVGVIFARTTGGCDRRCSCHVPATKSLPVVLPLQIFSLGVCGRWRRQ